MSERLRLAELLVARICHDFSGLAATLVGTTEICRADRSGMQEEALALAAEAASILALRLRFYRAAWGADSTPTRAADLHALAAALPLRRNTRIDLSRLDTVEPYSAPGRRVLLNCLLLGIESLPGGGVLTVQGSASSDVVLTIDGPGASWPAGFAGCLADATTAWRTIDTARALQAPLTALIAHQGELRLALLLASGRTDRPPPLLLALGG